MSEKHIEQARKLNQMVCVRIAPSPIHGVGIFALRDLPKGSKLFLEQFPLRFDLPYEHFGKLNKEVRDLLLERWPAIVHGSVFLYPDSRLQAYMNHNNDPNYDPSLDITIRDVNSGEELTEDYRQIPGWKTIFPWLDIV